MLRKINICIYKISEVIIHSLTPLEFLVLNPQFGILSLVTGLIKHFSLVDLNAVIKRSLPSSPSHSS